MKYKLYYLSTRDVRKNRADCVHIMKSCKEFQDNGFDVILVTPFAFRFEYFKRKKDIWGLYNIPNSYFKIVELPMIIWDNMGARIKFLSKIAQAQQIIAFMSYFSFLFFISRNYEKTFIYSKNFIFSYIVSLFKRILSTKIKHIFEYPAFTGFSKIHFQLFKNVDYIISSKQYHRDILFEKYGFNKNNNYVINFASQYEDFKDSIVSKDTARDILGIDKGMKIALYAGKISPSIKEIHYYLETAKLLPEINFYLIGAKEGDKSYYKTILEKKNIRNVYFVGFLPLEKFFLYLQIADVLLSYYTGENEFYRYQIGPAKTSLYSISQRPIIMPDLPSLRDMFNDEQVFFVEPDSPELLAKKIEYVLNNTDEANKKVNAIFNFAKTKTYPKVFSEISRILYDL